jgi:hypothetical protein
VVKGLGLLSGSESNIGDPPAHDAAGQNTNGANPASGAAHLFEATFCQQYRWFDGIVNGMRQRRPLSTWSEPVYEFTA